MNNIKRYIKNKEKFDARLKNRGFDLQIVDKWINAYDTFNETQSKFENCQAQLNLISKQIKLKSGNEKNQAINEASELKKSTNLLKEDAVVKKNIFDNLSWLIPNVPRGTIPIGIDEDDNVVCWERGKKIQKSIPHWEIMNKLAIASETGGVKTSGTRFIQYKEKGAELLRNLTSFLIDFQVKRGYKEVLCPYVVNASMLENTAQLPNLKDDLYELVNKQYLIPTSEVTLSNLHANELLKPGFKRQYVSYSACFRKESGAAGADTRGLIRIHQFNKVEIVKIVNYVDKKQEFVHLQESVEAVLDAIKIPYRKIQLCSGDLGFASAQTFDYEIWNAGVGKYREISSASICNDFQANRMKTRFLEEDGTKTAAITMNASALAIDRLIGAIIENNLTSDWKIALPEVLIPYFNRQIL